MSAAQRREYFLANLSLIERCDIIDRAIDRLIANFRAHDLTPRPANALSIERERAYQAHLARKFAELAK